MKVSFFERGRPVPRRSGVAGSPCAMRMLGKGVFLALFLVVPLLGCSLSAGSYDSPEQDHIGADILQTTRATNLYELIERERPRWLIARGTRSINLPTEIVVALNGRYYGGVESLRRFTPEGVRTISYVDGSMAGARVTGVGSRHVEAAILLEMRRR